MNANLQKRTVFAPQPTLMSSFELPANRVISVELNPEEEVEWAWTLLPDGTSYASGYTISPKTNLIENSTR